MERWPTSFWKKTFSGPWADPRGPFGSTVNMFWKSSFWPESTVTGWISTMASKFHVGPPYTHQLYWQTIYGGSWEISLHARSNRIRVIFHSILLSVHSGAWAGQQVCACLYLHTWTSMTSIEWIRFYFNKTVVYWLTVSHFCRTSSYICRSV